MDTFRRSSKTNNDEQVELMPRWIETLSVTMALALCSCATPEPAPVAIPPDDPNAGPWYSLGVTSGNGDRRIEQLLFRNGILVGTEGSIVYAVFVRESHIEKALELIGGLDGVYWKPADPPRLVDVGQAR